MTLDKTTLSRIESRCTTASALILAVESLESILDATAGSQYDPGYTASITAHAALQKIAEIIGEEAKK